ncbi:AsnC family transcriptional regulator [Fontibacillus phaseoli]|uniref:siroheme decarboxylase n=1 Tax=Fontibacillus phaseoli TaxID=1416533 RepID=A0A369BMR4_9BACL|nr:AsnC family transcriptional regulator [Fontibacillus phaseoli]RCX22691.1 AsnC family transcriptional regulator [Fontibacillus phaseoli]
MDLDAKDRALLNRLQEGLPLVKLPWEKIADDLDMPVQEVLQRAGRLKQDGMIRRVGGIFNPAKLGFSGRLYAMEVKEELFYDVAAVVNSFKGVTHNYRRRNRLNMWFTLSARTEEERAGILESIREAAGKAKIYEFPAEQMYKLKVFLNMEEQQGVGEGDYGRY